MGSARKPRPLGVQLTRLWPAMNIHNPITMPLGDTLQTIRTRLQSRAIANKAEVRQGVVLALLNELRWPVFDTGVVRPCYGINGDTVDFGLIGTRGNVLAIVIVDAPSQLEIDAVDPSLYLSGADEPLVVHTNGVVWRFMLSLPPLGIEFDKALTVAISASSATQRFESLLRRENLEAGHAQAELARLLAQKPTEEAALMDTWLSLLSGEGRVLPNLIADGVESRTGMRPSAEEVAKFFRRREQPEKQEALRGEETIVPAPTNSDSRAVWDFTAERRETNQVQADPPLPPTSGPSGCWFRIGETRIAVPNGKAVVLGILRQLEQRAPGFLAQCAAHPENTGSSRRYIGRTPSSLFPERQDLAADPGKYAEIAPGWLLMTNFSTDVKIRIIALAAAVSGLTVGRDIAYNLERQS